MATDWSVLLPIGFGVLMVTLFAVGFRAQKRRYAALRDALVERGVVVPDTRGWFTGRLRGLYRGRACEIRHVKQGKNGPWTTSTYLAHRGPSAVTFRAVREGVGTWIVKRLGGQDHEVGDHAFDEAYRLTGNDVDRLTFALGPHVRAAIAAAACKRVEVAGGRVHVESEGRVDDAGALVERLALAARVAERVEATA